MYSDIIFAPKNTIEVEILTTDPGYHYLKSLVRYKNCSKIIITLEKDRNYKLVNRSNRLLIWGYSDVVEISKNQYQKLMEEAHLVKEIYSNVYQVSKDCKFNFLYGNGWHISLADYVFKEDSVLHVIEHDIDKYYIFEQNLPLPKTFIDELIGNGTLVQQQ